MAGNLFPQLLETHSGFKKVQTGKIGERGSHPHTWQPATALASERVTDVTQETCNLYERCAATALNRDCGMTDAKDSPLGCGVNPLSKMKSLGTL